MSRLDLVVGPNGAGKTTFVRHVLAPELPGARFVDPDAIAAARWPEDPGAHAYEAMEVAAATRSALIGRGEDVIAETVFSHESKLDLVRTASRAGYIVAMHVLLVPVELSVARVSARVRSGGHDVPVEKIRTRFDRLWPLVRLAIEEVDTAVVWDNAHLAGPVLAAQFVHGLCSGRPTWPDWAPPALTVGWD